MMDRSRLRDWRYLLLYAGLLVFVVVYAIANGRRTGMTSDFNVFWTAGVNFNSGADLYSGIGGAQRYIYPPFAAMLFQIFALMPMQVAASVYTIVNFILFLLSIGISREILLHFKIEKRKLNIALLFGVLCSFRFFWYHTLFVQMNELMIVLCLGAVLASLRNREWLAIALVIAAAFIKVLPIFFIPWLLLRGNYKTFFKMAICTALCLFLPWLWRGIHEGVMDVHNYYVTFLQPFKEGRVEPEFHNQSLAASIYKICLPNNTDPGYNYQLFSMSVAQASMIYKLSFLLLGGLMIFFLVRDRLKGNRNTLRSVSVIIITMHLLSGITWEYHLVSLLFVYAVFSLYYWEKKIILQSIIFYIITFFVVLFSFVGRDTVGTFLYHYLEGYSVITWTMVLMFFYLFFVKIRDVETIL